MQSELIRTEANNVKAHELDGLRTAVKGTTESIGVLNRTVDKLETRAEKTERELRNIHEAIATNKGMLTTAMCVFGILLAGFIFTAWMAMAVHLSR